MPAAAIVPALHVAPGERRSLGAADSGVGEHGNQGHVKLPTLGGLLGRLNAATAKAALDGGKPDHNQHVGGEGAGLALGFCKTPTHPFREARTPGSRQGDSSFAHSWVFEMADVARRRVAILAPALALAAR